jgi:hypothetical protein
MLGSPAQVFCCSVFVDVPRVLERAVTSFHGQLQSRGSSIDMVPFTILIATVAGWIPSLGSAQQVLTPMLSCCSPCDFDLAEAYLQFLLLLWIQGSSS